VKTATKHTEFTNKNFCGHGSSLFGTIVPINKTMSHHVLHILCLQNSLHIPDLNNSPSKQKRIRNAAYYERQNAIVSRSEGLHLVFITIELLHEA
jgi:hypothetical protein